jgi:hypothetical protein
MSGWPISLALGQGGPVSFLLDGLGALLSQGIPVMTLNAARTLAPYFLSGYAGRDFPALSATADDVFGIDLSAALDKGDTLIPSTLATLFFPVDAPVSGYQAALDGPPALIGTVAAQAIGQPPAGRYLLGFTCATAAGRKVELHSFFTALGIPDAA